MRTEYNTTASVENVEAVTAFVDAQLEALNCPPEPQMQIEIAIDELFSNIAFYAYNPDVGPATVCVEVEEDPLSVIITFIDQGKPFNPLESADPDVMKMAQDDSVGGLGIFLVKKTMDDVVYEYKDGHNILTIKKHLDEA